jgi:hypothetical protein
VNKNRRFARKSEPPALASGQFGEQKSFTQGRKGLEGYKLKLELLTRPPERGHLARFEKFKYQRPRPKTFRIKKIIH